MPKRVTDVSDEYHQAAPAHQPMVAPASDKKIAKIRRLATPLRIGKLEKDVDAVLMSKGLAIDQPLDKAVKTLGRQPFGGKQAPAFKKKRGKRSAKKPRGRAAPKKGRRRASKK